MLHLKGLIQNGGFGVRVIHGWKLNEIYLPFIHVPADVVLHVTFRAEALVAARQGTVIRLLVIVDSHVDLEVRNETELFATSPNLARVVLPGYTAFMGGALLRRGIFETRRFFVSFVT